MFFPCQDNPCRAGGPRPPLEAMRRADVIGFAMDVVLVSLIHDHAFVGIIGGDAEDLGLMVIDPGAEIVLHDTSLNAVANGLQNR